MKIQETSSPNWIQEEARRLAEEKTKDQYDFERRKFERETLLDRVPEAFQALIDSVRQDIGEFNKLYSRPEERLNALEMQGDFGFQVVRVYDPEFELTVRLNPKNPDISYTVKVPHPANGSQRVTSRGCLAISLQKSLNWIFLNGTQAISVSAVSQMLLRGAIDPNLAVFPSGS